MQDIDYVIAAIDKKMDEKIDSFLQIGLRKGLMGCALYKYSMAKYLRSETHKRTAVDLIVRLFGKINERYSSKNFVYELVEIAWALEMVNTISGVGIEFDDAISQIDEVLEAKLLSKLENSDFDPVNGTILFGYYYLSRRKKNASNNLEKILANIVESHLTDERGSFWISKLNDSNSIYVGISHGIAAIIQFLICVSKNNGITRYDELIRSATNFILSSVSGSSVLKYPIIIGEEPKAKYTNNWCYGDFGTAYSIFSSGKYLNEERFINEGLDIFNNYHDYLARPAIIDAGKSLLYGSAGIGAIYLNLYNNTQIKGYFDIYQEILFSLADSYNAGDEYLGYRGYWNQNDQVTNLSFSEGIIGIGMFLMSYKQPRSVSFYEPFFYLQDYV